jgi:glutamine phosphoribosylpyrophosphate amidotransferase
MCGIFGIIDYNKVTYPQVRALKEIATDLLKISQRRGTDAAGVCVTTTEHISLFKHHVPSTSLANKPELIRVLNRMHDGKFRSMIGHTRARTKGTEYQNINNHPIVADRIIGVHNGIITNDDQLFHEFKEKIDRSGEVDSEIIFRLIDYYRKQGESIIRSVQLTCEHIMGTYHCAFIDKENSRYVTLFHSSGNWAPSLMLYIYTQLRAMIFASEEEIIKSAVKGHYPFICDPTAKYKVEEGGVRIDTEDGSMTFFDPKPERKSQASGPAIQKKHNLEETCGGSDCSQCAMKSYCE